MNIREQALGSDHTLEGALASAIKAAQAASAALESLTVSLMMAAAQLHKQTVETPEGSCGHFETIEIPTMGGVTSRLCNLCGETVLETADSEP